jgi:Zn-dependent peptidase ImmA (M78 family)
MPLSRLDLDGKGAGSPDGLVLKILKAEPNLPIPIPIEELCRQFDISSITYESLDGLEGALVTNLEREFGRILVRETSHRFRQRFTIGHELGHFLIPTHIPGTDGRFLCSRADMLLQHASEQDKRARMEVEANRFSALILIPPPILSQKLKGDPSLKQLTELALEFEVSKEAMARAYSLHHHEILAFVVTENGIVRRVYKHLKFPYISAIFGKAAPIQSLISRSESKGRGITEITECLPDLWISVERGKPAPKLYEQVMKQKDNFAMTMLWLENEYADEDDFDKEENMTSAQRYRDRTSRFSR